MKGQLRLLNLACASKARPRTVTLTRATRDEILCFQILGGLERGCGIFIKKVEKDSKAYEAGLKRGDQVGGQELLAVDCDVEYFIPLYVYVKNFLMFIVD